MRREANVLDHALVFPGCVVGERAVLGTFSLGAARQVFQPGSVATGNKKGQAVVLRKRPELPSGTTPLALLEAEARRRHKALRWTLLWNTVNILVAAILYPLRDVFEVCIISCGYMLYFYLSWDGYYAYLGCLPLLSAVTALLHCVIGTTKEGHNRKVREGRPRLLLALPLLLGPDDDALSARLSTHRGHARDRARGVVLSRHGGLCWCKSVRPRESVGV